MWNRAGGISEHQGRDQSGITEEWSISMEEVPAKPLKTPSAAWITGVKAADGWRRWCIRTLLCFLCWLCEDVAVNYTWPHLTFAACRSTCQGPLSQSNKRPFGRTWNGIFSAWTCSAGNNQVHVQQSARRGSVPAERSERPAESGNEAWGFSAVTTILSWSVFVPAERASLCTLPRESLWCHSSLKEALYNCIGHTAMHATNRTQRKVMDVD